MEGSSHGEEAVMQTNDDATCSKLAAVKLGYWTDCHIQYLCRKQVRKTPEINRGYYARVYIVRHLVQKFVQECEGRCQIINIGAGFDTLFWYLCENHLKPDKFVELDFIGVTRQKTLIIQRSSQLLSQLGEEIEVLGSKVGLKTESYNLIPVDLRNKTQLLQQLDSSNLDCSKPTLILAECVLMYMNKEHCDIMLNTLSERFNAGYFISYDVINMVDRFAEVMISNLTSRNCVLHINDSVNKQSQIDRFLNTKWSHTEVYTMNEIFNSITKSELDRINRIEHLDEVHLLTELLEHYCICISSNSHKCLTFDLTTQTLRLQSNQTTDS